MILIIIIITLNLKPGYLLELIFPLKSGVFININYEKEDYIGPNQTDAASIILAVQWKGNFKI